MSEKPPSPEILLLQVVWPDGSMAYFDLTTYCMISGALLKGTRARIVSSRDAVR
jgi:hypothetical protein